MQGKEMEIGERLVNGVVGHPGVSACVYVCAASYLTRPMMTKGCCPAPTE